MAYTYTNSMYEPRVRDFGDDYHLPDPEELVESSLLAQVKKIRRRYNNWFDFVDACNLYDTYMEELIDSYGGMKQFKLACLMGVVREYIPNYPELKKTKKNRFFVKHRMSRESMVGEPSFESSTVNDLIVPAETTAKIKVKLVDAKDVNDIYNTSRSRDWGSAELAAVANELDTLDAWWRNRHDRINRMKGSKKKKKKLRAALNRKQLRISMNYRSLTDMINIHDKRVRDKFMNKDNSAKTVIGYKGRMISSGEVETTEVLSKLKAIGVKLNHLSKSQTKLIRNTSDKKKKKLSKKDKKKLRKKEKKNKKLESKFISEFTHDDFDSFRDFEDEMLNLTGSRRWDK